MASTRLILRTAEFALPGMMSQRLTEQTAPLPFGWTGSTGPSGPGRTQLLELATGELEQLTGFDEAGYRGKPERTRYASRQRLRR